jgi:hypothetical protein
MAGHNSPNPEQPDTLDTALMRWYQAGIITGPQAEAIRALESGTRPSHLPVNARTVITPSMLLTWIGGFLVVVASIVFVGLGWGDMGKAQQFFWGMLAVLVPWGAAYFLRRTGRPLAEAASLVLTALGTLAIVLFGYTFYRLVGWWPEHPDDPASQDRTNELMMSSQVVAAVVAAVFAFRLRAPWMLLIAGGLGWIAWISGVDLWVPRNEFEDPPMWIMALYGVILVTLGLAVSRMGLRQHAFYLFLVGLAATFILLGIDSFDDVLGPTGLTFLALAIAAIVLSMWIEFRVFLVFGAIGLYGWVSALVIDAFGGSRPVAFGLIVLGVVIVMTGLAWQRWFQGRFDRHGHNGMGAPAT